MALPLLEVPKYELTLLNGTTVPYRPFLVKEQKILLTALSTGERKDALRSMLEVTDVCTFHDKPWAETLPPFELERLFLNIRAKSVGEQLPINIKCDQCDEPNPYNVHLLDDMQVLRNEKPQPVKLSDSYGLILAFPAMRQMAEVVEMETVDSMAFYLTLAEKCLVGVYQGDEFYTSGDSTPDERKAVFSRLGPAEYQKLQDFFDNMPALAYTLKFKCKKCSHDNELTIEGTDSFFG